MATTVFNTLFFVAYLLSAAVQYNDPDALIWIGMYLAAAAMCVAQYRNRQPRWLPPVLLMSCLVWIGTLLPEIIGKVSPQQIFASISMQTSAVEEAREIGGLLLISIWSGVLAFRRGH